MAYIRQLYEIEKRRRKLETPERTELRQVEAKPIVKAFGDWLQVGRKNWLFAGSDEGGQRAAIVYSLIATCARLKIDPFEYLKDALRRRPSLPPDQVAELTPKAWLDPRAAAASAHVAA